MNTSTISILFLLAHLPVQGASIIVNWSMTPSDGRQLTNKTASPLSPGSAAAGDGTLLELGYYSMATVSDPFAGSWTVLSTGAVGDDGIEVAGRFSLSSVLGGDALPGLTTSTPLAIRYYDATTVGSSTYFNAVSNNSGTWNYIMPYDPAPILTLAIDKGASTVFQSGLSGAFSTAIPVPEPCAPVLVVFGSLLAIVRRSRK